jgi:two-component system chemotaxis response regulator CheY
MKILVLERDPKIGQAFLRLMKNWKMEGVLAKDCETARAHLAEFPIDVFVADFAVREINVLKLIRGLRRSDQYMNLPVLMLSTNAGRHEIIEASQAGVNGFLAKPFVPDSLQKKIIELYRL